jgi:phosphoribosylformylglycinamidine synthase
MAFGFNPYLMEQSPYDGAYLAVCESVAKLVAAGFARADTYLTLQEYFERLGTQPRRWGKPLAALLGALAAQDVLDTAAIGGKDSMSGSFEGLDVPPTLVSFAVAAGQAARVVSPEFKRAGDPLVLLGADPLTQPQAFVQALDLLETWTAEGKTAAAWVLGHGGLAEALEMMALGNGIGARLTCGAEDLFGWKYGHILVELREPVEGVCPIGETIAQEVFQIQGEEIPLDALRQASEQRLAGVFPRLGRPCETPVEAVSYYNQVPTPKPKARAAKPRAFLPVFPGTNCELDTVRALERAGAAAQVVVINNQTPAAIGESVQAVAAAIAQAQMIVLPGGFSGGDEPDGSAKLILSFFRNPRVADAVTTLLETRDGLMLGICNGFQALIKLGLVPYGRIQDAAPTSPTLTYNQINRHQSMLVQTRVASVRSPWLSKCQVGDLHTVAISHGEGRFAVDPALYQKLAQNGQVATQYTDPAGHPTYALPWNPNGSYAAVEALTSPDGRILGKMGHTERAGKNLYRNVPGAWMPLFEGGVGYFG